MTKTTYKNIKNFGYYNNSKSDIYHKTSNLRRNFHLKCELKINHRM